ncbi:MAG: HU family DNA-binding protein [Paludibacteraceae bacterium]|jgi:DNA-binding protein HU-beta|nr:HU family DNA-binding protein [Paludibacteraceae bacterium]MBR6104473.1 HU family DNA-binding protein [Paludibacteraceae bacterium]
MNKSELIDAIASQSGLTKANSAKALDAIISSIQGSLKKNDAIQLIGFGTFSVDERAAREGRNPSTGETIKIAAKKVAKFKPSKNILD